ncbi:MAG: FHA domain-containing serine/threonine-protein kinase [Bacteroidales bacterium]|nr:FHA domain-containing serine/threonine-protein kinase [Bacteroidales bacterium]
MGAYVSCSRCDFQNGSLIDSKYTVDKELGEGTFGKVFRVRRSSHGKYYALKLLKLWAVESYERERLLKRFIQEYETGCIKSDYLVQSYGNGNVDGNPYIVMEYCPGGDLLRAVESGAVDLTKAASEVLLGLRDLHANGKVHRDLKPENVLIRADGTAVLTDFSIAGDRNKRLTERGLTGVPKEVFGTYAYMPPEQVNPRRGDATVLPTTDIFSFGVMMFQLLTGELPFGSLNDERELYEYVNRGKSEKWGKEILRRSEDGESWFPLIAGCLKADFRIRIQTADLALKLVPRHSRTAQTSLPRFDVIVPKVETGIALRVMQGEEFGKIYKLNDLSNSIGRRVLTVGRDDDNTHNVVAIKETESSYVSRKHCTLEFDPVGDIWSLRDGQWDVTSTSKWKPSVNGTFIGSKEVPESGMIISIGDIVSIGDVKLRVEGY